jgi:hypothetical protein
MIINRTLRHAETGNLKYLAYFIVGNALSVSLLLCGKVIKEVRVTEGFQRWAQYCT